MSVRGEFRRLLGDVLAALRAGRDPRHARLADELEPCGEQAGEDLSAAAERTLALLSRVERDAVAGDALERLDAICRVILGRS